MLPLLLGPQALAAAAAAAAATAAAVTNVPVSLDRLRYPIDLETRVTVMCPSRCGPPPSRRAFPHASPVARRRALLSRPEQ
eukprot:COSAG01_NODE_2489_length_7588_cov_3.099880_9_plen_81_part_00